MSKVGNESLKRIALFLGLTILFSAYFYSVVIDAGSLTTQGGVYVLGLMWSPGLAALITKLFFDKSLRGLGWGWGKTRYQALSYGAPILYSTAAYGLVYLFGFGAFPDATAIDRIAAQFSMTGSPDVAIVVVYFLYCGTIAMIGGCLSGLGEEIGWRGFLVPELFRKWGFARATAISGGIWAVWHYPAVLFTDYSGAGPTWYSLLCFTVMLLGYNTVFAWLRLKSGSLWTAMFLHASHNVFIQNFFNPLTAETGHTGYFIGEFGAALALVSIPVGIYFFRKRSSLDLHSTETTGGTES